MAGWTEVRKWCEGYAADLPELLSSAFGDPISLLVVALDVDIAIETGIINPPWQGLTPYVAKRLCNTVKSWLRSGQRRLPTQLVIALPAMTIETWIFAAPFRDRQCPGKPETVDKPAEYLFQHGQLATNDKGRPRKQLSRYQGFAKLIGKNIDRIRNRCPEAERLCNKIEQRRDAR